MDWCDLLAVQGLSRVFSSTTMASVQFSSVQSLSHVRLFATTWITARQASLSITNSQSLLNAHWVGDAIEPSHSLLSLSPPTFNLSQHQGLFKWVSTLNQVAKVLEFQLQYQSFQRIFRTDFLYNGLVWSSCCPRDSRVFSNTTVQKHQFFDTAFFIGQFSHPYITTGKP